MRYKRKTDLPEAKPAAIRLKISLKLAFLAASSKAEEKNVIRKLYGCSFPGFLQQGID